MAAAPLASWSHILTQVSASLDSLVDKPSAEPVTITASPGAAASSAFATAQIDPARRSAVLPGAAVNDTDPPKAPPGADGEDVADWMAILDIINGMSGLADEQKNRLRAQSASHQAALDGLQRDLKHVRQLLQLSEMRTHEIEARADIRVQKVQAEADAQVQDIRAEAEARVRTIRAETEAWMRAAEEQVRVADLRASTAEKWLQRIDAAAKTLLLGGHMRPDQARD